MVSDEEYAELQKKYTDLQNKVTFAFYKEREVLYKIGELPIEYRKPFIEMYDHFVLTKLKDSKNEEQEYYYLIQDNGDGSSSVRWFKDKELAEKLSDCETFSAGEGVNTVKAVNLNVTFSDDRDWGWELGLDV